MRRFVLPLLLAAGCVSGGEPSELAVRVACFTCDATPPIGHPLINAKPLEVVDAPLLLKGIVLQAREARVVIAALDWCTTGNEVHRSFRRTLAAAAGTTEARVALQCTHTHSAPFHLDGVRPEFLSEVLERAAKTVRESLGRLDPVTQVGIGRARVVEFASNRRVPGPEGKIRVRYSSTKDPALRAEPEGLIDPWLRTVTLFDGEKPRVRLHYYASHPQSFYNDGHAHPDIPGWARARLEKEEGIPHLYFTGCGGNVTAGKYNDGSPEARAALIDRLADGMRRSIAATRREPLGVVGWTTREVRFEWRTDPKAPDPTGPHPVIELSRLTLGPAEILHLPGEPFVEFQLYAQDLRPDRFVAVAGYGNGTTGYICLDRAHAEGGMEPGASRVGPPSEGRLKDAIAGLLGAR